LIRHRRLLGRLLLLLGLLSLPGMAGAQEQYNYSVGLLGGIGGSVDADPGDSLGNTGYQLNLNMVTEPRTLLGLRAGQMALDDDGLFGSLTEAELSYVTVSGEYRFRQSFYDSGFYLGLGGYRLEGTAFSGGDGEQTSVGAVVGATGDFPINNWLGVMVEFSGHYVVDFDDAQFFVMGHGGLAIRF